MKTYKAQEELDSLLQLLNHCSEAIRLVELVHASFKPSPDAPKNKTRDEDLAEFLREKEDFIKHYRTIQGKNVSIDNMVEVLNNAKHAMRVLDKLWYACGAYELSWYLPQALDFKIRNWFDFDDSE